MGELLDLYRTDLDKGREYLFEHMSVFSNVKQTELLYNNAKDIYNDTFLVIDSIIIKSLQEGYEEKQIYKYIKRRVWGELTNRKKKYGKLEEDQLGLDSDTLDGLTSDYGLSPDDIYNDSYFMEHVYHLVLEMEEPYKTIMILIHYSEPRKSYKQIGLFLGMEHNTVFNHYQTALSILQEQLKDENLY